MASRTGAVRIAREEALMCVHRLPIRFCAALLLPQSVRRIPPASLREAV